jgi:hypothetical protein
VSPVVWRVAGEVAFLIAVAVALGLANLSWWAILLAMGGALLIVCAIEWAAGREELTYAQPASAAPVHPILEAPRSEDTEEHDALGWTAFEEAQEPSDAMTIIGALPHEDAAGSEGPAAEPEEDDDDDAEPELPPAAEEEEQQPESRKRWWRRGSDDDEQPATEEPADPPRHVRVLSADESDPWERGFDAPVTAEAEEVGDDAPEEVAEEGGRKIFRRR